MMEVAEGVRRACIQKFLATRPAYPDFMQTRGDGGSVYLIGAEAKGRVKIGYSKNVTIRLRNLQQSSPALLRVLWEAPGNFEIEGFLHDHFSSFRIKGEWFDFAERNPVKLVRSAYRRLVRGK